MAGHSNEAFDSNQTANTNESVASGHFSLSIDPEAQEAKTRRPSQVTLNLENGVTVETVDDIGDDEIPEKNYVIAAIYVKNAKHSKFVEFKEDDLSLRYYEIYNNKWFHRFSIFCHFLLFCLIFVESPGIADSYDSVKYTTLVFELLIIIFLSVRLWLTSTFTIWTVFKKDPKNYVLAICLILTFLDMVLYIILELANINVYFRWSRYFRPIIVINCSEERQIRRVVRNIRRLLFKIIPILILIIMMVAVFSLLTFKLFVNKNFYIPGNKTFFKTYEESFWQLWILSTTSNDPDVMMPAYSAHNTYSLVFIIFYVMVGMVMLPILLAITMDSYKKNLSEEIQMAVKLKRKMLNSAFDLIKSKENEEFVVTKLSWTTLIRHIDAELSHAKSQLLFSILDDLDNQSITRMQFFRIADLLNVRLTQVIDRINCCDTHCWRFYDSKSSLFVRKCIKHMAFEWVIYIVIFANAICIGLDINREWIFLSIFSLEIVLRIYANGCRKYFLSISNIFDFSIIVLAVIFDVAVYVERSDKSESATLSTLVDVIMIIRILRLVKVIKGLPGFDVIISTIVNILPSFLTYVSVLMFIYYLFALLGMQLFAGLIHSQGNNITDCGNAKLLNTEFLKDRYCENNFNNGPHAFVTLFELMVVNQWHVITEGHVAVTSKYARIFFFSFGLICLIVLNIFLAFVVEVFILEYKLSRNKIETAIETKIKELGLNKKLTNKQRNSVMMNHRASIYTGSVRVESTEAEFQENRRRSTTAANPDGIVFHLKKKGSKSVEQMLETLFEQEIGLDEFDPEVLSDMLPNQNSQVNFKSFQKFMKQFWNPSDE